MNWIVSIVEIMAMQEAKQSYNVIVEVLDFHNSIVHFLHDAERIA